jgi:hypothetical protein
MARNVDQKVAKRLQEGLELYGAGEVGRAFLLWNEVLELDPGNEEALDYMRDADRRARPRAGGSAMPSIVEDARRLVQADDEEGALELLASAPAGRCLESEAMIELLRARLFRRYQESLGDPACIPRLVGDPSLLRDRNLPPSAGFLLSMVDGRTPLSDLVSVSGMDRFEALRSIHRMHRAGILELAP